MQQLEELRGRLRHVEGMAESLHGERAQGRNGQWVAMAHDFDAGLCGDGAHVGYQLQYSRFSGQPGLGMWYAPVEVQRLGREERDGHAGLHEEVHAGLHARGWHEIPAQVTALRRVINDRAVIGDLRRAERESVAKVARHGDAAAGRDDDPATQFGGSVERLSGARQDAFVAREKGAIQIDGEETVGHAGLVYPASPNTVRLSG